MHFLEENSFQNSDSRARERSKPYGSIDEDAPVLKWDDASSMSSNSRLGKPMSRGSSSSGKTLPSKTSLKSSRRRHSHRSRIRQQNKTTRREQQVDSTLARLEATEKSPDLIRDTLVWMEDGNSSRNSASDVSGTEDESSSRPSSRRQTRPTMSIFRNLMDGFPPELKRAMQSLHHQLLTYKATASAWCMHAQHDLTTFWDTNTPQQRTARLIEWCILRKVRTGMFILLFLTVCLLRRGGSHRTALDSGAQSMQGLQPLNGGAAVATTTETYSTPIQAEEAEITKEVGIGAASYFDNVDSLRRGSPQVVSSPDEPPVSSGTIKSPSVDEKEESIDEPDVLLTAPWRPRTREESKKPPPGLPEAYWHPRHKPITTKAYAKLKNAEHPHTTVSTHTGEEPPIKEYIPVVGNPTLEQWQRNQDKKQQLRGA